MGTSELKGWLDDAFRPGQKERRKRDDRVAAAMAASAAQDVEREVLEERIASLRIGVEVLPLEIPGQNFSRVRVRINENKWFELLVVARFYNIGEPGSPVIGFNGTMCYYKQEGSDWITFRELAQSELPYQVRDGLEIGPLGHLSLYHRLGDEVGGALLRHLEASLQ